MIIIILQHDGHHLQFAKCCFNHFLAKLADCWSRTFVCNFCKSLRIIFLRFETFVLDQFCTRIANCCFRSFLEFFKIVISHHFFYKIQIVVPNQFLCKICNLGQAGIKIWKGWTKLEKYANQGQVKKQDSISFCYVCILSITKINPSNRLQVQR